jgi:hypothetical protein
MVDGLISGANASIPFRWSHEIMAAPDKRPILLKGSVSYGNERMSSLRLSTIFASAVLATVALAGLGSPASAQVVIPSTNSRVQIQQNDLQTLQNRVQRQQFQQQQQQYRAQDRVIVQQPPPVVPQVKPSCQTQIIGNTAVSTCR